MSKKLIAVAAAAALALTGLVGIAPANANAATIVYSDNVSATATNGTSAATAFLAHVPQSNALVNATGATGTTLKIVVSNLLAGDTVTISASAPAKVTDALIAQSTLVNVTTLGAASVTETVSGSDTTATLYVYTTSTSVTSTISISITETDGTTKSTTSATRYIKGQSVSTDNNTTNAYKVANLTAPTNLASGVKSEVTFNIHDAFGNVLETANVPGALTASSGTTNGQASWDTVRKLHVAEVTSTTGNPFVLTVDVNGSTAAPANLGLGASASTSAVIVNSPAVASANAALTAQVAALTAQLANSRGKDVSVTKKRYNNLAKRWNRSFPGQAVKLK